MILCGIKLSSVPQVSEWVRKKTHCTKTGCPHTDLRILLLLLFWSIHFVVHASHPDARNQGKPIFEKPDFATWRPSKYTVACICLTTAKWVVRKLLDRLHQRHREKESRLCKLISNVTARKKQESVGGISPLEEEILLCHVLADAAPASEATAEIFFSRKTRCYDAISSQTGRLRLPDTWMTPQKHYMVCVSSVVSLRWSPWLLKASTGCNSVYLWNSKHKTYWARH